jgi:cysteine synthase A
VISNRLDPRLAPRIVDLGAGLHAVAFECMKAIPARYMLDRARDRGELRPGATIVESSSGTFGLGLAQVAALEGFRFELITDPSVDAAYRRRLEDLGATVRIAEVGAADQNVQAARMALLRARLAALPDAWWPCQYDNPDNAVAYAAVAAMIAESMPRVDWLVAAVGSGGSSAGLFRYLSPIYPGLKLVGVDTFGSVLFGLPAGPRALRGLGNSLRPRNVVHTCFDEVTWIRADEAFAATRLLHRRTTLFQGPTSGAAWWVGRWIAARHPGDTVLVLMPDAGHRYLDTVYDDAWLRRASLALAAPPDEPARAASLAEVGDSRWTVLRWGRRPLDAVAGVAS